MTKEKAEAVAADVFLLYEQYGSTDYIGEPVSQIEHMLQAAQLAENEGYEEEVILAAFFHDIGHLVEFVQPVKKMDGVGVLDHEKIGADYLAERGFSERLCQLVQSHVAAKRYLTAKYPAYYEKLSDASKQTLAQQGGRMTPEEIQVFKQHADYPLFIRLREWDDKAKETDAAVPPLQQHREMAVRHLVAQQVLGKPSAMNKN